MTTAHTATPDVRVTSYGCTEVWTSPINGVRVATFTTKKQAETFAKALQPEVLTAIHAHDDLVEALKTLMYMDVKGHALADRLQFFTKGREILSLCQNALTKAEAV
jgi:hypothetical protein